MRAAKAVRESRRTSIRVEGRMIASLSLIASLHASFLSSGIVAC